MKIDQQREKPTAGGPALIGALPSWAAECLSYDLYTVQSSPFVDADPNQPLNITSSSALKSN
jgi:hypothetical protein